MGYHPRIKSHRGEKPFREKNKNKKRSHSHFGRPTEENKHTTTKKGINTVVVRRARYCLREAYKENLIKS